jgi:hypothetical protein
MMRFNLVLAGILLVGGGCHADPAGPVVSPLAGVVFINEFMAANDTTLPDEAGDFDDWIELYNAGSTDIEMRTMYLTDDLTLPMKWTFPDTILPAGGRLIVWADGEYTEGWLHTSFKLNADPGEQLGLFETDGERVMVVDSLSFGVQRTDTSYGRFPDGGDWRFLAQPTPGGPNRSGISPLRGVLFINEFLAANDSTIRDEAGDYDDWVELYNSGTAPAELAGVFLTDNIADPQKWAFPDTSIPAGGFLLVWADNEESEGPLHAPFNLAAAAGEELGLFVADSPWILVVDTLRFGPQAADTSFGRLPDGGAEWRLFPDPTPGESNGTLPLLRPEDSPATGEQEE